MNLTFAPLIGIHDAVSAGAAGANSPAIERPRAGYPGQRRESA